MMTEQDKKRLTADQDGLETYEYIANHIDTCSADIEWLVDNMISVDRNGQFLVSAARYLTAIDRDLFAQAISRLVAVAIDKDRERRYIGDLLESLYGSDYRDRVDQLNAEDDNFRRIYKRLFPAGTI